MSTVPIPLQNCSSVKDFFEKGGEIEASRPAECINVDCLLKCPLWRNGGYLRQVVYWGFSFLVYICRFRCRRCGKTVSCPYAWLVPYRRFSCEVVAAGVDGYADGEVSYKDLATELWDMEFADADPEIGIGHTQTYRNLVEKGEEAECGNNTTELDKPSGANEFTGSRRRFWINKNGRSHFLGGPRVLNDRDRANRGYRPAHTTVFSWVKFMCDSIEELLVQLQKELVREWKRSRTLLMLKLPAESAVENPNSKKAASEAKAGALDRLSYASLAGRLLLNPITRVWQRVRAYFLTKAESRKDLLTSATVLFTSTHSFEQDLE